MRKSIRIHDVEENSTAQSDDRSEDNSDKNVRKNVSYVKDFTSNTSLHGLKYTGEEDKSKMERVWWAIMVVLCLLLCGHLIRKVLLKWQSSPVIVTFAESPTSISQIPFPAITICPTSKTNRKLFNFTALYVKPREERTDDENNLYSLLGQFCVERFDNDGDDHLNETYIDRYLNVSLSRRDIFASCEGFGSRCSGFKPILTSDGLCYTFNMLNLDEIFLENVIPMKPHQNDSRKSNGWALDGGYTKESSTVYPVRARTSGKYKLILTTETENVDHFCSVSFQGFKMSLHAPNVVPPVANKYFWVPPDSNTIITVKPSMINTSETLISYSPEKRQCYFTHERKLLYFKEYTRENCDFECIVNATLVLCECVLPMMPRINASMPICGQKAEFCMHLVESFYNRGVDDDENLSNTSRRRSFFFRYKPAALKKLRQCNCLPSCTGLAYETSLSHMNLDWDKFAKMIGTVHNETDQRKIQIAFVEITFQDTFFISSRRSELYGVVDFLANCGGLLGVCLGFSILSLVEVVYFFIIRVIIDIKNKVRRGEKENIQ